MGMFIDPVSIVIITVPILIPVPTALQFDLIWFGVVLMVNNIQADCDLNSVK